MSSLVTILVRGGFPILIPIAAFPATAESLYANMVTGLGLGLPLLKLSHPFITTSLTLSLLGLSILYLLNAIRAAPDLKTLIVDGLELVLLAILFTFVEAYLAVGFILSFGTR